MMIIPWEGATTRVIRYWDIDGFEDTSYPIPSGMSESDALEVLRDVERDYEGLDARLETSTEVIYRPIWSRGRVMMMRLALTWGLLAALAVALFAWERRMASEEKIGPPEGSVP